MNAFALLAPLQGRPCPSSVPFSLSQAPCSVWEAWLRNQTPSSPLCLQLQHWPQSQATSYQAQAQGFLILCLFFSVRACVRVYHMVYIVVIG